jgi:hypothetical protein
MIALLLAAMLAQWLDLVTYNPAHEINPVVLTLGLYAPLAKLVLMALFGFTALAVAQTRYRRLNFLLLGTALVVGIIGTASNIVG